MLHESGFEGKPDRLRMEMGEATAPRGLDEYATTAYLAT
jgi:hypothetical protein